MVVVGYGPTNPNSTPYWILKNRCYDLIGVVDTVTYFLFPSLPSSLPPSIVSPFLPLTAMAQDGELMDICTWCATGTRVA